MKKTILSLFATALLAAAAPASATVVSTITQTFASGATFTGDLTFADNYQGLLDVDGTLSGAGYGSIHFGWTWNAGTAQSNPRDHDGNIATYEDWLMNGDVDGEYNHFIGLSWLANSPTLSLLLSPNVSVYHAGIDSSDAVVSVSVDDGGEVPEPASLALLGAAALAFGALRRRA